VSNDADFDAAVSVFLQRVQEDGLDQLSWDEQVAYAAGSANNAWRVFGWVLTAFIVGACLGALAVG
jgi:preprotein translocase subunit SecG